MKLALLLLALPLACDPGADGPLPEQELRSYQLCEEDTECFLANNQPSSCCQSAGISDPVAINRDQITAFRDAFDQPNCDRVACAALLLIGPQNDPAFIANKYQLGCQAGLCAITETREHTGDACTPTQPCPSSYDCRELSSPAGIGQTFCFFVGP